MCHPILSSSSFPPKEPREVIVLGAKGDPAAKTAIHDQAIDAVWQHTQEVLARVK